MTNTEVRIWYLREVLKSVELNESWKAAGMNLEERARMACEYRHKKRLEARKMMEDPFDVEILRRKYVKRYGNPDGPTFEWLIEKYRKQGITGDAALEAVIESAKRSNEEINKLLGL